MTRIAIVRKDHCNSVGCGDFLCIRKCPINRKGEECIYKDDDGKAGIDEHLCIGCDICVKVCPFDALSIINLPAELDKSPIHQYGRNGFHLYNLPVPQFGKVVGIIGKNGIGKSTALKILAGQLKPNLGRWEENTKANVDELIEYFKGTEAQAYFERLKKGEVKIAYKPQQVELIPKMSKGSVRELLERVDEKGELDKICKLLGIEKILGRDIQQISGGELQRVAIAATVLRKADVYFFDEPTSYLDIKQRIKVSKFIRELAKEDVGVMVIEHDLIILDYMTDVIHIMYGKETCYGIVSLPKTTRVGINVYLEGYIREENMRFRDHAINFQTSEAEKKGETPELTSWKGVGKKLGDFSLVAPEGRVHKKEVVGILGENGIGKTTFAKILAGVIKGDSGEVAEEVKVAYKPQYIEVDPDKPVAEILMKAIEKYENQLIQPLELSGVLTQSMGQLSGGQLQRVAVAFCLSQDADLYLLDEPSAYLDVEQRLVVSKVIKERMIDSGKTALVVDHDLLFIDYMSDKLFVFEGEPAVSGKVSDLLSMQDGMNMFLAGLELTFRRDHESNRPRANKPDSQMDRKQKEENKLYYL